MAAKKRVKSRRTPVKTKKQPSRAPTQRRKPRAKPPVKTKKQPTHTSTQKKQPTRAFIFMLRHGQAQGNEHDVFNGSRIDAPLTDKGLALAGYVAMHWPFRPAAIFSSPLARAMQTARPLAARFGMQIIRMPKAMEQDYGSLSGKTRNELMVPKYRRYFHYEPSGHIYTVRSPGGGESWEDLKKRAASMFRWLDKHYAGQKVVVVSHSDFINCAYGVRNHLSNEQTWRRRDVPNGVAVRL